MKVKLLQSLDRAVLVKVPYFVVQPLETMDDGNIIYMNDEVVKSVNHHADYGNKEQQKKALSYFGLVFQNFNLFPHFTVLKISLMPLFAFKKEKNKK